MEKTRVISGLPVSSVLPIDGNIQVLEIPKDEGIYIKKTDKKFKKRRK